MGLAGDRSVRLQVAGVLPAGLSGVDSSVVFVDIATAQELFDKLGRLDRIDRSSPTLPAWRRRRMRCATCCRPGSAQSSRRSEPARSRVCSVVSAQLGGAFRISRCSLSMYLIYNTVAISVVQRRPEIGTLRALGVKRMEILRTFLAEGAHISASWGRSSGSFSGSVLATFSVRGCFADRRDGLYVASHADR